MTNLKTGPKDVFMQLLSILGLYVSVVAFGSLVFQLINVYMPDVLNFEQGRYLREGLKWPLSILVVVFPVYFWLSYTIQKDVVENLEKREMKIRKWLIYFTLSLAAVVIVGDLVALIYNFLNGEITTRFILKVLTVFAIAASVFVYYNWNLRRDTMAIKDPGMRIFIFAVVAVVVAAIAWGFYIAGSPQSARLQRFDDRRVSDLQILQSQIFGYYQVKSVVPETLEGLSDDITGFIAPVDPQTGTSYEYTKTGDLSFELCGTFSTVSDEPDKSMARPIYDPYGGPYGSGENWSHGVGRNCFERTIDPTIHPSIPREKLKML